MTGIEKSGERGIRLRLRVTPRSSKTSISGNSDAGFRLKVKSPPVEGAANEECVKYLAKTFHVSKSGVTLIQGGKSRDKVFGIEGITLEEAIPILEKFSE